MMDEEKLANILREFYDKAKRKQTILMIDLFGIEYGNTIRKNDFSIKRIVQLSEIGDSYITEVTKAVKLSEYVNIKTPSGGVNKKANSEMNTNIG